MKKSDQKGFLLAEAIVVAVFVLSLFTFLFVNVIPLIGKYEANEKYDTIDGIYNANLVRTMIMEDDNVSQIIKLGTSPYKVYNSAGLCSVLSSSNKKYCDKLLSDSFLNVKNVYITWYRTDKIKNSVKSNYSSFSRAARDYISGLSNFNQPSGSVYAKYHRLIIEFNDGSFSNIEIKVGE